MRQIALRAAVVLSIAVALSPAPASAKPPGTPNPQDAREAQRLFESRGRSAHSGPARCEYRGSCSDRVGDGRLDHPGCSRSRHRGGARRRFGRGGRHLLLGRVLPQPRCVPLPPLGRGSDLLVLPLRRSDHLPVEQHVGTRGRRVLRQQRARLEGHGRRGLLVGGRASRGGLLVHHALVVPAERHAVDGGDLRLLRKCVAVAVGMTGWMAGLDGIAW